MSELHFPGFKQLEFWRAAVTRRLRKPAVENSLESFIEVGAKRIPLVMVRNPRARRYIVRLRRDGCARVTIPRGGSAREARAFVERSAKWLSRQVQALSSHEQATREWTLGTEVLFRGELVKIEPDESVHGGKLQLAGEMVRFHAADGNFRPAVEKRLREMAGAELPGMVFAHAAAHNLSVRKVIVRNQRSRWGSCSARGTISLNWRLIQAPPSVGDYVILHELMHFRQMNHSRRFWAEVSRVCPDYKAGESWLKRHAALIH